jgi:adenylosuccinate synthase
MRQLVLLSGRTCTGKSELAKKLEQNFHFNVFYSRRLLDVEAKSRGIQPNRLSLQALGDMLDKERSSRWLIGAVAERAEGLSANQPIVVDNIRNWAQLVPFRERHDWQVLHVHLYASSDVLERRFRERRAQRPSEAASTFVEADIIKNEHDIDRFKGDADIRINTDWLDPTDMMVRVAARLGLYAAPDLRCVDVLIGGQYGSEGKGHIAAYLAREYSVLMRVGGPNAGHTVSTESGIYTYHHLPSGSRDTKAEILLGPGMTIRVPKLLSEIDECGPLEGRLFVDPQAMIIEDADIDAEAELKRSIGSTAQGGGAANARRIMGRMLGKTRLARDVPELNSYIFASSERLETAYRQGKSVLLEGTQGSGLSIFHGTYPFVTSRDTNVAGCLAEAGISPNRIRRTIMVVRSMPIRVGHPDGGKGESGPLKYETAFETVGKQAGRDPDEIRAAEKTSTTKRDRRIGRFEWEQFRKACALNTPTDIALTFADYLHPHNSDARRFEQLHIDTIKFIEELERVAHAPVSLINTRFVRDANPLDLRSVIDRRNWTARNNSV